MGHLDFTIWVLGYSIASSISLYLSSKRREIEGKEPISDGVYAIASVINMIIWIFVAIKLY